MVTSKGWMHSRDYEGSENQWTVSSPIKVVQKQMDEDDQTCTACEGPLRRDDDPPGYDPSDTSLCWECDLEMHGGPD